MHIFKSESRVFFPVVHSFIVKEYKHREQGRISNIEMELRRKKKTMLFMDFDDKYKNIQREKKCLNLAASDTVTSIEIEIKRKKKKNLDFDSLIASIG